LAWITDTEARSGAYFRNRSRERQSASTDTRLAWDFGESSAGTWDEFDLDSLLGEGDAVIGNRWHATSTDALSICGFSSWWKKNEDVSMRSPVMYFGYLPVGHTTGTIDDVTVLATSTVASNLILSTTSTKMDTYLPACMTVNDGITWAIYYEVRTASSSYVTYTNDLGGDNHVQLYYQTSAGTDYNATGDLKMGMAQLITSEAPAVSITQNCTYGVFCPLVSAIQWLFVPSPDSLSFLDSMKEDLALRVPFGYFTTVTGVVSTMETSSETETTSTAMTITDSVHSGTVYTLFDFSSVKDKIPSGTLTLVKNTMAVFLWAMFFNYIAGLLGHGFLERNTTFNQPEPEEDPNQIALDSFDGLNDEMGGNIDAEDI